MKTLTCFALLILYSSLYSQETELKNNLKINTPLSQVPDLENKLSSHATVFKYILDKNRVYFGNQCRFLDDSCQSVSLSYKYACKAESYDTINKVKSLFFEPYKNKKKVKIPNNFHDLDSLFSIIIFSNSSKVKLNFKSHRGLKNLRYFGGQNIVFDSIPEFLYNCKKLEAISIYVNGTKPVNFEKISKLKKLRLIEIVNVNYEKRPLVWSDLIYDMNLERITFIDCAPVKLNLNKLKKMKNLTCLQVVPYDSIQYENIDKSYSNCNWFK